MAWVVDHVAATLIGLLVTALAAAGVAWIAGKDRTPGQQIDQVRASLEKQGLEVRGFQQLKLHAGAMSYLFAVGKEDGYEPDEVRIYDQEGSSFHQDFSFAPTIKPQNPEVKAVPFDFNVLSVTDPDGDGQKELLGSYDLTAPGGVVRMPVALVWSPAEDDYRLAPLLSAPPKPRVGRGTLVHAAFTPYRSSYNVDAPTASFKAWTAESLVLLSTTPFGFRPGGLFLGTGYPAPNQPLGQQIKGKRLQIGYWSVNATHYKEPPAAHRLCWNVNGEHFLPAGIRPGENPEAAIERGWRYLVETDERSRRGEANPNETVYIGGYGPHGECFLGE